MRDIRLEKIKRIISEIIHLIEEYKITPSEALLQKIGDALSNLIKNEQYLLLLLQEMPDQLVLLLEQLRDFIEIRWNYLLMTIRAIENILKKTKLSHRLLLEVILSGNYPIGDLVEVLGVTHFAYRKALLEFKSKAKKKQQIRQVKVSRLDRYILQRLEQFRELKQDFERLLTSIEYADINNLVKLIGFAKHFSRERAAVLLKLIVDGKFLIEKSGEKLYVKKRR